MQHMNGIHRMKSQLLPCILMKIPLFYYRIFCPGTFSSKTFDLDNDGVTNLEIHAKNYGNSSNEIAMTSVYFNEDTSFFTPNII